MLVVSGYKRDVPRVCTLVVSCFLLTPHLLTPLTPHLPISPSPHLPISPSPHLLTPLTPHLPPPTLPLALQGAIA
ncbi:hypothetical protein [Fischerella sp. JS2]|uniref:hypothetical protein n=1 Tax=Fischerella sp. JS2 TaxID=2597771 RepID=UPI0028ECB02A|nr:hypothetical protein [Fischerella sp. JS2]